MLLTLLQAKMLLYTNFCAPLLYLKQPKLDSTV